MNELLNRYLMLANDDEVTKALLKLDEISRFALRERDKIEKLLSEIQDNQELTLASFIQGFFIETPSIDEWHYSDKYNKNLTLKELLNSKETILEAINEQICHAKKIIKDEIYFHMTINRTYDIHDNDFYLSLHNINIINNFKDLPIEFLNYPMNMVQDKRLDIYINIYKMLLSYYCPKNEYLVDERIFRKFTNTEIYLFLFDLMNYPKHITNNFINNKDLIQVSHVLFIYNEDNINKIFNAFKRIDIFYYICLKVIELLEGAEATENNVSKIFNCDYFIGNYDDALPLQWNIELLIG